MKKLITLFIVIAATTFFVSCKSEKKEKSKETKEVKKSTAAFVLANADHKIDWVAYKTTDKVAVKGKFKEVKITSGGEGNSAKEAINNAEFSIPVSSIFTSDSSRDFKIRKYFFGVMNNTKLLSGKFTLENDSIGSVNLTMNGVSTDLLFTYKITGKQFTMQATMDVLNWNAQSSIDSLNMACKDLHKGLDGVSKTWTEVALNISSTFK
ncbi:YceI family protein [Flavobacteriaceae bacterium S356]|uniref:YceI family protein n=1 Tax=Asprobacillus argus TaxID=3076534 RepID=A0ABU3LGL1_9FLAO|nr:YceI family protein [Flavobacteriaceae bacterium S356]